MTVIYNMSIDRADKPWIGDRRFTEFVDFAGCQKTSDVRHQQGSRGGRHVRQSGTAAALLNLSRGADAYTHDGVEEGVAKYGGHL
jgi:hypothetical protein